jgi:hypothetical protein
MCASCERWLRDLPARLERMKDDPEQLAAALKALAQEPGVLSLAYEITAEGARDG